MFGILLATVKKKLHIKQVLEKKVEIKQLLQTNCHNYTVKNTQVKTALQSSPQFQMQSTEIFTYLH